MFFNITPIAFFLGQFKVYTFSFRYNFSKFQVNKSDFFAFIFISIAIIKYFFAIFTSKHTLKLSAPLP